VRRLGFTGYELGITDLEGHAQTIGRFTRPEELDDFTLDADQIAWVWSLWRPYTGHADDGLPYRCDNGVRVLARAPIIEVHSTAHPGRMPVDQLPRVSVARAPSHEPPFCPDED
jgi:hypothetical protein